MQNDKIRTSLFNWLELANSEKQITMTQKCKIIIVIDGIDLFELEEGGEEPPDWLAHSFPSEFRVIVSCKPESKAY